MILFGRAVGGDNGAPRPVVHCDVDGTPASPDPRATDENFACSWQFKGEGTGSEHRFFLNASIPNASGSSGPLVSIDSVWFAPSLAENLSDPEALVMYDHNDPHVDYTGDWQELKDPDGIALMATKAGSSVSVVFTG